MGSKWPSPLLIKGFPGDLDGKESDCNVGDPSLIPGLGRSPGGGNGNPFQYSCLENSMDRGAWWATVHGITKNGTQLSMQVHELLIKVFPSLRSCGTCWKRNGLIDISGFYLLAVLHRQAS